MKKVILMAAAVLLLAAQVTVAQGAKAGLKANRIGYVDLQRALNESNDGKAAKIELQAVMKGLQADIDKKIAERDQMKAELEKQSSVLSPKAKKEKEAAIDKLTADTQQLITESNTEMQQKQRAKEVVILKKIKDAIEQIGKSEHYTVILPADVILYADGAKELTDEVIQRVNQTSPAAAPSGK
ncbi:MAG: OmpH family outer membrane protein [Nitrospiraceae bacterium]|nr:OmpH family outer membrane protein [Nitrospiraceae bacterium]